MAATVITILPVVILFLIFQRAIIRSIMQSAIKD